MIGETDPKKKNITQESGQLLDSNGVKIDEELSLPSHWGWCSWKVNKEMVACGPYHVDLHQRLHILFRCDGKCNTNNGDDQKWDKYSYSYVNTKTDKQVNPKRPYEVIQGLRQCPIQTHLSTSDTFDSPYEKKVVLCKAFEKLVVDCSDLVDECLGNVAMKEIVWSSLLKHVLRYMLYDMDKIMEEKGKDYFGNFTYNQCPKFGGKISGANQPLASCIINVLLLIEMLFILKLD